MKATFQAPIYQKGADRFEIDKCGPQLRAVREGKIALHALTKGHYPGTRMDLNTPLSPGLQTAL